MKPIPPTGKVLVVCTVDVMAWGVLRHWLSALRGAGYEVHIACADGRYVARLREQGYPVHVVPMRRSFSPWAHLRALVSLMAVMRRDRFDIVNTHSPIGGLLGRIAAWLTAKAVVVSMIHGFYFHENMAKWARRPLVAMEWLLGAVTDHFLYVSDEDRQQSRQLGIQRPNAGGITLYNGVDTGVFFPDSEIGKTVRNELSIPAGVPVVGIVARIVQEKGFREFLAMARAIGDGAIYLIVGDSLDSDRDRYGDAFRSEVADSGLSPLFRFVGETETVERYLCAMNVFVLPSYREGFPVSILEAMSAELPVVATNIRGCRESVVDGQTGLLVAVGNGEELARAVGLLIDDTERAIAMGRAGRQRVVERYSRNVVQARLLAYFEETRR